MKTSNCQAFACRHCRYYTPVGRRGGNCQQLDVPVRGGWKACSLAMPPFAPSWEGLEGIMKLHQEVLRVTDPISLTQVLQSTQLETAEADKQETRVAASGYLAYLS